MGVSFPVSLTAFSILVRWLVGQFPYSGYNDPPMYGDYEAQRHWMEITSNLNVRDWYKNGTDNDLLFWGLDYPPLTAYHMYALGSMANRFINSSWTELHKSRGLESYEHKLFMRSTVLVSELIIYTPAIIYYFYKTQPFHYSAIPSKLQRENNQIYTALLLLYPAQVLIDHGHFQYNSVFMGLVLWAVIFMTKNKQYLASIAFTLALTYKQMSLYYSLPFFWFIASKNLRVRPIWRGISNIIIVGLLVMVTLALIFMPYLHSLESIQQVFSRLFPIQRGLFEDKVANFWFSLSVFYKLRGLYTMDDLLKASTAITLVCSLPAGLHLLFRPNIRTFKYSLVTTSMAFFLFSFQVHEKTILVPALPILLMASEHPLAAHWFVNISTFSLQPLLMKDGQLIPYIVLVTLHTLFSLELLQKKLSPTRTKLLMAHYLLMAIYYISLLGCFVLGSTAVFVTPPAKYPHLHPTLNALYSFGHFFMFFIYFYYSQFTSQSPSRTLKEPSILMKKNK